MAVEEALRRGDVARARRVLGDPPEWPNCVDPYTGSTLLSIALAWAPLAAIRELLSDGADPNFHPTQDGFPSLLDVLHHRLSDRPELPGWKDGYEVLALLLEAGADVHERGINDWTPLHCAVAADDPVAVRMLLDAGADPNARTRIDDCDTPLEMAERSAPRALAVLRPG